MPETTTTTDQPFLPRYEVTGLIGEGAAARVYRVTEQHSGAVRAIKLLRPETNADPAAVKQFEDEFRILRRLHHPSLPEVYGYGFTGDGCRYIVMEFVEGRRLDDYFDEHPGDLWLILYELCEVLVFIHNRNLLHLDLKPANILVKRTRAYGDEKPMVVLMDFGLSYRRDSGEAVSVVGTPEYMAPEIIRGDDRITRAADYYSLGISLYELLEGEAPFKGRINDVFAGHLQREVRFREEKTEHAELYPHVLGLVGKEINPRLEAFEDFRRAVIGRMGGGVEELDRVYGQSIIASIGLIGKETVWREMRIWLSRLCKSGSADENGRQSPLYTTESIASTDKSSPTEPKHEPNSHGLSEKLILEFHGENAFPKPSRNAALPTAFFVDGISGSGKSYIIERFVDQCHINGHAIWSLGDNPHHNSFSFDRIFRSPDGSLDESNQRRTIDPASVLLDSYAEAWKKIVETTSATPGIVVVDPLAGLGQDNIGFLRYVFKRLEISRVSGDTPDLHFVFACDAATLNSTLGEDSKSRFNGIEKKIQPLTKPEIDETIKQFCINQLTRHDYSSLHSFLLRFDGVARTISTVLNELFHKRYLIFTSFGWRFRPPDEDIIKTDQNALVSYYTNLINGLPENARRTLKWICCNNLSISIDTLSELSGISKADISDAYDALHTYNLVSKDHIGGVLHIGMANSRLRKVVYNAFSGSKRHSIHEKYIRYYTNGFNTIDASDIDSILYTGTRLAHQLSATKRFRQFLIIHIKLVKSIKSSDRYSDIKNVCRRALSVLNDSVVIDSKINATHTYRYFLKHFVFANWAQNDFESIRTTVDNYWTHAPWSIPVGIYIQYCLSLLFTGHIERVMEIVNRIEIRSANRSSEKYIASLLIKANALIESTKYSEAKALLDTVEKQKHRLSHYGLCRLYLCYIFIADRSNDRTLLEQYESKINNAAKGSDYYNEMLAVNVVRSRLYLNESKLALCKRSARTGIVNATKHRSYRRLLDNYFSASAAYYEEGSYKRSIKYVQKALTIAKRLGLVQVICELETRLAMNYFNSGALGNAMKYVEMSRARWNTEWNANIGAVILLFSIEVHLALNSDSVSSQIRGAETYLNTHPEVRRFGYLWYLQGLFHLRTGKPRVAAEYFSKARKYELGEEAFDDATRAGIKEGFALLDIGDFRRANRLRIKLGRLCRNFESPNIFAEYHLLTLSYLFLKRAPQKLLEVEISRCAIALDSATEFFVLALGYKQLFRIQTRLGDIKAADSSFRKYLRFLKTAVSNMPNMDQAARFLDDPEKQLVLREYEIFKSKR